LVDRRVGSGRRRSIRERAMVRSHLEHANSVWNPYHVQEIKALEQVQMRATKILASLKNKPYEERLKILKLLL